ncbi:MAG TPA: hypothetical protein VHG51_08740 [Longimicrobiaceae bacterium]|nr:hypothetical protein [Longimicrobiaceae bacterium]
MATARISFTLEPRRVVQAMVAAVALLVAGSLAGQVLRLAFGYDHLFGFVPLFYVDREANLPAWYSSMTLLFCGVVLGSIASDARREGRPHPRLWAGLAAVFCLLSVDEAAGMHELVGSALLGVVPAQGVLFYAWVLPGGLFVVGMAAVYFRFLLRLPARTRALVVAAAGCFVFGALGMEMATGYYVTLYDTKRSVGYLLLAHGEELLEMVGIVVFVYALLDYKARLGSADEPAARSAVQLPDGRPA